MDEKFKIRLANESDSGIVLGFIKMIAEYENMSDEVVNTEQKINEVVFKDGAAKVFIGEENGIPVGFALLFETYSTFVGKKGIHLEDLFVIESKRKCGYGKALFKSVAEYAENGGYGRMEWCCLDWNTPSQKFYEYMGAEQMKTWWTYRLSGKTLKGVKNK